jgi:hypothetical protein
MQKLSVQAPRGVVMIRPHHFSPNAATAEDNVFQATDAGRSAAAIAIAAHGEVTRAAEALEAAGVAVHLFEDEGRATPDSVFPNNWFSTHSGGHVALYPMFSPSRRRERRQEVIEMLKQCYRVQDVIDYSGLEQDGVYLEGTGAMVLDHIERVAAARSNRTNEVALERFCTHFNFEPAVFDAVDAQGRPIYHTNVLMCVGTDFCLVGSTPSAIRRGAAARRAAGWNGAGHDRPQPCADRRIRRQRHRTTGQGRADRGHVGARPQGTAAATGRDAREICNHPAARGADHRARGRFGALHACRNPPGRAKSCAERCLTV